MTEMTITTNGTTRTVRGKQFGTEFRVYAVHGDTANHDELREMAQELAIELAAKGVTSVELRI